jgi:anti-sigma-K factor RskA
MMNERMEELASLYILGILAPAEQSAFEAALARDPELRALLASLRTARDAMAGTVPVIVPSPGLKHRIMTEIATREKKIQAVPVKNSAGNVVKLWLPWALAAAAVLMLMIANHDHAVAKKALEVELSARSAQIKDLNRMADALRNTTNTLQQTVAALRETNNLENVRIALLASLLTDSPKAVAVSLWDNQQQSGVFVVQNLKPLPADRDYQLWVIDPKYKIPVSAGVFQVDNQGDVRLAFKANKKIVTADKFAVTLEPKGGLPTPTLKNLVLLGG